MSSLVCFCLYGTSLFKQSQAAHVTDINIIGFHRIRQECAESQGNNCVFVNQVKSFSYNATGSTVMLPHLVLPLQEHI